MRYTQPRHISKSDLYGLIIRSFFLQASWNFQRMQSLGFVFILSSILQKLYDSPEERTRAFIRHLSFFNTHPYFASFILGTIARMEEKHAHTGSPTEEEIKAFKTAVSGPYAAIGDLFFWGALRPLAATLGLVFILPGAHVAFLGPAVFFVFYNLFHLQIRIMGVIWGYFHEELVPQKIQRLNLIGLATRFRQIALAILGAMTALTLNVKTLSLESQDLILKFCALILVLLFSELNRLRWSIYWQLIVVALAGAILTYVL